MSKIDIGPIYLSIKLATITTIILLITSLPIAWWLSKTKQKKIKSTIEAIITLPLVLPPTILGFYILLLLNNDSIIGKTWFYITGVNIAFSFSGLIIGSCIYSLPFAIQPIQIAFEKIGKRPIKQATLLKASKIDIFFNIIIPLSKKGIITSCILTFAHTLGEFGIILMIGGNIPEKTKVVSIAIYEAVEELNYILAHKLSVIILCISLIILIILYIVNSNKK